MSLAERELLEALASSRPALLALAAAGDPATSPAELARRQADELALAVLGAQRGRPGRGPLAELAAELAALAPAEPGLAGRLRGAQLGWTLARRAGALSWVRQRRGGVHYTPPALARALAGELASALAADGGERPLRLVDPACGGGALLLAALDAGRERGLALSPLGVDQDPVAVELARGALALAGAAGEAKQGEALLGPGPGELGGAAGFDWRAAGAPFDALIANPPFIENKRLPAGDKAALKQAGYACLRGLWDLAVPFCERALSLVRPGGWLALVLPNKLATRDYAEPLRRRLLGCTLTWLHDASTEPAFEGAAVYPLLLLLRRDPPAAGATVRLTGPGEAPPRARPQAELAAVPRAIWPDTRSDALRRVLAAGQRPQARRLGRDLGRRWYRPLGFRWPQLLPHLGEGPPPAGARQLIGCASLLPYRIDPTRPLRLGGQARQGAWLAPAACDPDRWRALGGEQLLVRELGRELTAAAAPAERYVHLTGLYGYGELPPAFSPRYLAALLNSRLLREAYRALFWHAHLGSGYLDVKGSYLELLPLLPTDDATRATLESHVATLERGDDAEAAAAIDAAIEVIYP